MGDLYKKKDDPGEAAKQVCIKAVDRNSKDNVTCMIVAFQPGNGDVTRNIAFEPGSVEKHAGYIKAYKAMAEKAYKPMVGNAALAIALEKRYDYICDCLS